MTAWDDALGSVTDKPIAYVNDDGVATYRASSLFTCTSALLAARLGLTGAPPPAKMQERFDQGHAYEGTILERARTRGFSHLYALQDEVSLPVGKTAQVLGHIDALGNNPAESWVKADSIDFRQDGPGEMSGYGAVVVDAKAFAPYTWKKWVEGIANRTIWEQFPYYAWQLSIYSHAYGGIPIAMAIGLKDMDHPDDVRVLDFRLDVFTVAPISKGDIVKRVLAVEKLAKGGVDAIPATCDYAVYPCPYYNHGFHTRPNEAATIEPVTVRDMTNLTVLADMRAELYAQMKGLERQISNVDDLIREEVDGQVGNLKLAESEAVSSLSFYHHKSSVVDWDRLGAEHGVKKDDYLIEVESPRLSVKVNPRRAKKEQDAA